MKSYVTMTREELLAEQESVQLQYDAAKSLKLKLNMARGKPGKEQLDLVSDLMTVLTDPADCIVDGIDARNYGELSGLPCAKKLYAELLGCKPSEVFVGGNSSLSLMYSVIAKAWSFGLKDSEQPWCRYDKVKFLCPAPGYDRHFRITESFGMELIYVPMTAEGPDMDLVEELIKDEAVRGMWCVPKYSNPDGIIYSDAVIHRIANMKPAAKDFALMWDNAYCVHEFEGDFVPFEDILTLCREAGRPNMPYEFASTSKITFPGAGISVMAMSEENLAYLEKLLAVESISFDKVNQLRHVRYLRDKEGTLELMKRHAEILGPKFKMVLTILEEEIAPLEIAQWAKPKGGYFVSVNAMAGTAKRTLQLCKEAGVVMTDAGATFPYGKDPQDSNIRVAPSLPPVKELRQAMEVFCLALRLAAIETLLAK